jgi:DNA-binding MarR family transcriptional regulator
MLMAFQYNNATTVTTPRRTARKSAETTTASSATEPLHHGQVLRQFRMLFNAVRRHFHRLEKQAGIGGANVWALSLIEQNPGIGVSRLAEIMDIHQSTVSNLLRSMIKSGLIHTEKSAKDRRAVEIYALPEGLKILKRISVPYEGVLPRALSEIDQATLERLHKDLQQLIDRIDIDENAAQTPLALL